MTTHSPYSARPSAAEEPPPTPTGNWYCGLSFLEKYRFGKPLKPATGDAPSPDHFFRGGWLDFLDAAHTRLDKYHYDQLCTITIDEKRYKDRDFFIIDIFYPYS